jgi:eukaryotic-like serine/threonine-protein kinase
MDQLKWKRISELFAAARVLDGERRLEFLEKNCGLDRELFEQVKSLLDVDEKPGLLDSVPTISTLNLPDIIAGRFRIVRFVGVGGMGTVYEAEDLRLHERVALKTIRPDIALDPKALDRFKQEIVLGKKVTHPNVCRVHDLGIDRLDDGTEILFLTMQFLRGGTLALRVKQGPIPKPEAMPLIEDMAAALAAAHHAEVIHRDFKSGNVMLVQGANRTSAIVTDFGLALDRRDCRPLTREGLVGTVDYMAPEQIRGEEITPAADIYALGVVMYEMATGRRPFQSDSKIVVAMKHLNDDPTPPRDLVPELDSNWDSAILGCLRKDPQERFASILEVRTALVQDGTRSGRRLPSRRSTARAKKVPSIAVLIFRSLSPDPEDEYFSHGLTDELIDALTNLDGLRVAPRTSVRAFEGKRRRSEAAAKLNVDMVLDGSIRRSGSQVRINVHLIHVAEERVLWAERFDRNIADIFVVQEEIAARVVAALRLRLGDQASPRLVKRYTQNLRAYNLYLKGRYQWNRETPEALFKAVETLRQSADADPRYISPLCGLAECYLVMGAKALLPPLEAWRKAREASDRALSLDPTLADAHGCMGAVLAINDFNWAAAEREFHQALELNPESALTRHWYAIGLLAPQARFEEAIEQTTRAIESEPLSLIYNSTLAWIYYLSCQWKNSVEQCAKTLEIDPHHFDSLWCMGATFVEMGQSQEALAMLNELNEFAGGIALIYGSLGHSLARVGNFLEAEKMLRAVQESGRRIYASPLCQSWVYANLPGQAAPALDCLEKAYADRDFLVRYIHLSPALKPLHDHPRFLALVKSMGLDYSLIAPTVSLAATKPGPMDLRRTRPSGAQGT